MIEVLIEVNRAVLLELISPLLGLTTDYVEVVIVEALPNSISVITKSTSFFLFFMPFFILILINRKALQNFSCSYVFVFYFDSFLSSSLVVLLT